ncbi:MAG TPA: hypothetical protein VEK57_25860 [Thermoanaerobaculia bacterium]|nr:hypothetical protein [Thermoanaerobaculia bacterium]
MSTGSDMVPSNDPPNDKDSHASLHERYFESLVDLVLRDFGIPRDDAENLVDEVLAAAIRHLDTMPNVETWLTVAVTHAARRHLGKGAP